jgi:hypothetical protein
MQPANPLTLTLLPQRLAICRFDAQAAIPAWGLAGTFYSLTRTGDELSLVCAEAQVPDPIQREGGWRAFKVDGPLDFALTGILAGLAQALAQAGISLFALSTYDTDYVLVREAMLPQAVRALSAAGYRLRGE